MSTFVKEEYHLIKKSWMETILPPVINEDGKKHILQHKYRPGVKSWAMPYLDVWWEFAVQFIPHWFAPNLLTLISFIIAAISFFVYAYYDPEFKGNVDSPTLYIFQMLSIFMYNTLDSIDGKHARNTLNSSPLGQLFDHGCDAITHTTLVSLHITMLGVGPSWYLLYCLVAAQIVFYALNWRARHTGVFDFGKFSIDETFLLGEGNFLMAAFWGTSWMTTMKFEIFGYDITFGDLAICALSGSILQNCIKAGYEVSRYYEKMTVTSGDTTQQRRFYEERYFELGNLILFHISLFAWNTVGIISINPTLFIVTISMTFAHLAHRLIICDVTQQKSRRVQYIIIPFVVIGILAVMERISGETVLGDLSMRDERVLTGVALYSGYFMWAYAIRCMLDISNVLDIYIFRYNVPKEEKKEK